MSNREQLLSKLKDWPAQELDRLAGAVLLLKRAPDFQGSLTLHYAGGKAKRLELKEARDI